MADLQFQTIFTQVQAEVDDDGEDLAVIKTLTNDICRRIYNAESWRFRNFRSTMNTAAGTRTYSLLSSLGFAVKKLNSVGFKATGGTSYAPLDEGVEEQFDGVYSDISTLGQPFIFLYDGDTLTLHNTPNVTGSGGNLQIRGLKGYTEMVDDDDVAGIPSDYLHIIKAGVKWQYYHFDDDTREQLDKQDFWIQGMAELRMNEMDSTDTQKTGRVQSHKFRR